MNLIQYIIDYLFLTMFFCIFFCRFESLHDMSPSNDLTSPFSTYSGYTLGPCYKGNLFISFKFEIFFVLTNVFNLIF